MAKEMLNIDKFREYWYDLRGNSLNDLSRSISSGKIKLFLSAALFANLLLWLYSGYVVKTIDEPLIALHYNIDSGIDFYGQAKNIYTIPLLGFVAILFNFFIMLISARHADREYVAYLLLSGCLMVNLILLTALRLIYLVNFK
jgi:hypothetical protein